MSSNKGYADLSDVIIRVIDEPEGNAHHLLKGIELSSPTLSMAAAHGLTRALNRPDSQRFLLDAGMSHDAIRWLITDSTAAAQLSDGIRIVLPSMYFNGRAALELSFVQREASIDVDEHREFHDSVINYLILAGAHAAMMFDVCGMTKTAYDKRITQLTLQVKSGRPSSIKNHKITNAVLDAWAKLLREQKAASERAARNNEPYIEASIAELYIKLHMLFPREDISAIYSVVESYK